MEVLGSIPIEKIFVVIIRSVGVFIFALLILRLLGKRHLAHLSYLDLLIIISLGSAVGDVMIYEESTAGFLVSMVAITVVGAIAKIIVELASRIPWFNVLISGAPTLIVEKGEFIKNALDREDTTKEEVFSILREKNIISIKDVYKMYIEPDGEFSIVLRRKNKNLE